MKVMHDRSGFFSVEQLRAKTRLGGNRDKNLDGMALGAPCNGAKQGDVA
tara:strand:+ start:532 stop:678 length:147 start_codon:yes stop_codon:yes gene_type:complete